MKQWSIIVHIYSQDLLIFFYLMDLNLFYFLLYVVKVGENYGFIMLLSSLSNFIAGFD